ncbi:MAG: hypothetical protein SF172_17400 [Burkholderiales bacterium]|nr:hypothetical protein [Burkholderiales bacterium]
MKAFLKTAALWAAVILLIIAGLIVAQLLSFAREDSRAEHKATKYCQEMRAGTDVAIAKQRAAAIDVSLHTPEHSRDQIEAVFPASGFSVYICKMRVADNKIVSAQLTYIPD